MKKEKSPYDQAVQYLSQVQYIDEMIGEKQDIIESMRSSITGTSASVEGERVQTSPKDRLGETCVKIVDLCTIFFISVTLVTVKTPILLYIFFNITIFIVCNISVIRTLLFNCNNCNNRINKGF